MSLFYLIRDIVVGTTYRRVLKPIFFSKDPECVHDGMMRFGVWLGSSRLLRRGTRLLFGYAHPILEQDILGIHFSNPIGLSAGFDKNAELTNLLGEIGFGFAEIGSVTGEPCDGNAKPRLWRLPEKKSLRVYYGLKNDGATVCADRLMNSSPIIPIGISIAKTNGKSTVTTAAGIADYQKAQKAMDGIGAYLTVNISCPNAFGGQPFTDVHRLHQLLEALKTYRDQKPVFIKLSPDLSIDELNVIADVGEAHGISGYICSNLVKQHSLGVGGLSGKPVAARAEVHLKHLYRRFGRSVILVGCGGVFSAEDAYRKIRSGASLIQLITGMIYEGPQLIGTINRELVTLLKQGGFSSIEAAIGIDVD